MALNTEKGRDSEVHEHFAFGRMQIELHAVGGDVDVGCGDIRAVAHAECQNRNRQPFHDTARVRIVHVDDRLLAVEEEDFLCLQVFFERFVVVHVILRQVRKQAHVELDAVHAILHQRMGADFHNHEVNMRVRHGAKNAEQVYGLRRGTLGMDALGADHIANGADDANLFACLLGDCLDHIGRGGLAVRAGNAQHHHFALGITVERGGHFRHCLAGVFHDDLRNRNRQFALD
jgi:hypothetical protein